MSPDTVDSDQLLECKDGYFCLFEGPNQTGKVLYAKDVHMTEHAMTPPEEGDIEPPIFPRSARNPIPDDIGCIARLNDQPNFEGDEQEIGFGNHELDGRRVASITVDCG
jgi:Peptidase inhibitor family I36